MVGQGKNVKDRERKGNKQEKKPDKQDKRQKEAGPAIVDALGDLIINQVDVGTYNNRFLFKARTPITDPLIPPTVYQLFVPVAEGELILLDYVIIEAARVTSIVQVHPPTAEPVPEANKYYQLDAPYTIIAVGQPRGGNLANGDNFIIPCNCVREDRLGNRRKRPHDMHDTKHWHS